MGLYRDYIGVILGLYWGYIGIMEKKMETTIMENQMEKNIENYMETWIIMVYLKGFRVKGLGLRFKVKGLRVKGFRV